MATASYMIKNFGVLSIAKFFAVTGLIWGILAGLILLVSYLQGYLSTGQADLLGAGALGLVMMIIYGVAGGFVGGAIVALVYNRMLGAAHGIVLDLEIRKKP